MIKNLLKIKSIVTIIITMVFCYLAIAGRISGDQVLTIYTAIVAFYFGTQKMKEGD